MRTESVSVLTPTEIRNIRRYVQHKYSDLPSERRAEIVADAMQRIIMKQLPDFPESIKNQLTGELLRDAAVQQQIPVRAEHIFHACLSLDYRDKELFGPIHVWTQQQLNRIIEADWFRMQLDAAVRLKDSDSSGLQSWRTLAGHVVRSNNANDTNSFSTLNSKEPAKVIALPVHKRTYVRSSFFAMLSIVLVTMTLVYGWLMLAPKPSGRLQPPIDTKPAQAIKVHMLNELPSELQYTEVDEKLLVQYLHSKSSLLADKPYLEAILKVAKEKDIHPLLMFAITGQEQAFVPRTHKMAKKIANNPFNVFYSWKAYNTTIEQSARIAATTINRLSKDRPYNKDAITWINREYAEDPNWSKGVTSILQAMKRYIQSDIER
ncbi:hypothetical protein ACFPYJ_04865 [Paenibacillus solisilvae]|uniref:Mannosyl-glycoprotein endo-beta-N-acetylglucosamidase-like domain-containing protein n=1 Tax=Paenibacillus solisilvae TaxID=2486751 RepID=A0ABW0VRG8_9BACL